MLKWITFAPLIGALLCGFLGKKLGEKFVSLVACGSVAVSMVLAFFAFFTKLLPLPEGQRVVTEHFFTWIEVGTFRADFAYLLDPLSGTYILFITGVGLLIHIYATGYMHGDEGFYRFFAYLNLFMFMMLTLVLGDNLLLLFVGWEGVGLCSYLLIGYYIERQEAGDAAKKAFIVNRIGDFGYSIGVMVAFTTFTSVSFVDKTIGGKLIPSLLTQAAEKPVEAVGAFGIMTAIALLLFVGACGKSAQVPLFVWLPDAMAGPTPVSALIHAATMVTAGVYLTARCSAIFTRSQTALLIVAVVGAFTAMFAATIGIAQNDIKKVLAYSTVSQLGYMFLACGVGAFTAGIFHVMTHAFFKALLFLGAGSVIHGMHEEQDIRRMGGLKKYMPWTFKTMMVGWLAISGVPLLSGFFSKDEILWQTWSSTALPTGLTKTLWFLALATALLTAVYMTRLMVLTFWGKERFDVAKDEGHHKTEHHEGEHHAIHPHESPKVMWIPLVVLAVLSIVGGYVGVSAAWGGSNAIEHFLSPVIAKAAPMIDTAHGAAAATASHAAEAAEAHHDVTTERIFTGISVVVAFLGIFLGWTMFTAQPLRKMPSLLENKYYVDEIYDAAIVNPILGTSRNFLWRILDVKIIDGAINGIAHLFGETGSTMRFLQTGFARSYAAIMLVGAIVLILYFTFR
ncbi:MAG: NADH-quinone oxidoreductase subunit L [Acidobacteria bacterium]|nr:NADH-quinone oxidoreductase subunit L [Acidobacteriota bacterium]